MNSVDDLFWTEKRTAYARLSRVSRFKFHLRIDVKRSKSRCAGIRVSVFGLAVLVSVAAFSFAGTAFLQAFPAVVMLPLSKRSGRGYRGCIRKFVA